MINPTARTAIIGPPLGCHTTQCPYCIDVHRKASLNAGATEEELAEVTFIAAALRAGAAVTHGTHLID